MNSVAEHPWGRIDADGNVYVRSGDAERLIGQWLSGDPEEGFAFYERRFAGLATEVDLLEKRLAGGALSPEEASQSVQKVSTEVAQASALGDLGSLQDRLQALNPTIEEKREERRVEREAKLVEASRQKERIAARAEAIAAGSDWRGGADTLRELLDEWKTLPRLSKRADEELWRRFSTARSSYTKRRKAHFAEQSAKRDDAAKVKEKLIGEAEALSGSTDWGPTSGAYRELMSQWRAAGAAPRGVEDKLWKRFRAAQDVFFAAREDANAAQDREFAQHAEVKRAILVEAEALLPIEDLDATRQAWQGIAERWEAAGKAPRDQVKDLEGRLRAVEQAIRIAGEQHWERTDPEKSARAGDMVSKLQHAIDETRAALSQAEASGDDRKAKELQDKLTSQESFLTMAEQAASDFS